MKTPIFKLQVRINELPFIIQFNKLFNLQIGDFYRLRGGEYLQTNGVQSYMRYADSKIREEEARAQRYLEAISINALSDTLISVLIKDHLLTILAECCPLIKSDESEKLNLMFRLLDRVGAEGIDPMLEDLENHIGLCYGIA